MEFVSIVVSAFALLFSFFAFKIARRQEIAKFDLERDYTFEGRLADWPKAFTLHGIDVEAAKAEGVLPEQIAYLILSINGLLAYCEANNVDLRKHLNGSDYRQRMFAQPDTRRAWRYARLCIPDGVASQIDEYLTEKYSNKH